MVDTLLTQLEGTLCLERRIGLEVLIEEVEALWAPIAERDDWTLFHAKLKDIELMRQAYADGEVP